MLEIKVRIRGKEYDAIMYRGKPMSNPPKTWKKLDVIWHSLGNLYNPDIMTIYKAKDGSLRYEIYRDGSIYPFYGRIEIIGFKND